MCMINCMQPQGSVGCTCNGTSHLGHTTSWKVKCHQTSLLKLLTCVSPAHMQVEAAVLTLDDYKAVLQHVQQFTFDSLKVPLLLISHKGKRSHQELVELSGDWGLLRR